MARRRSAGLLMYRRRAAGLEVFLVHPGGPYYAHRDEGAWGLPKGMFEPGETALEVARREFHEETGQSAESCSARLSPPRDPDYIDLGSIVQKGGKRVSAWAFEGDWPPGLAVESNLFRLQWPPRSDRWIEVPEVDRGEFYELAAARIKIKPAQEPLIDRLVAHLETS